MYKLRIYEISGAGKGKLYHQELFATKDQIDKRYNEFFNKESSFNPTAWELVDGEWKRLEGY